MDYIVRKWQNAPIFDSANGSLFEQICRQRAVDWQAYSDLEEKIHDPFLFSGMAEGVELVQAVIEKKGSILIHGDYDADGLTATAVLYHFLKNFPVQICTYIPNRLEDGYGLSDSGVDFAMEQKIDLVITVDCGSTSHAQVQVLRNAGIPVIVTDHHQCKETLPQANVVINPQWPAETYPFRELSGSGVAFKFVQALAQRLGCETDAWEVLDLAAIGMIADLMPLVGENRVLVQGALAMCQMQACRPALCALSNLFTKQAIPGISAGQIAFQIAPKINAAGRMGDNQPALDLLLTDDMDKACEYAQRLFELNEKRRNIEAEVLMQARQQIWEDPDAAEASLLLVAGEGWHHGVLGIVAARLMNEFCRSTVVLADDFEDGQRIWAGSGRGSNDFNLLAHLQEFSPYLQRFGGHQQAAGLQLFDENLPLLKQAIARQLSYLGDENSEALLPCDLQLDFSACTLENYQDLQRLQPFGKANDEPKFSFRDCEIIQLRNVGKEGKHLQFILQDESGRRLKAIAFQAAFWQEFLAVGVKIDLLAVLQLNEWQGVREIQLRVESLYPSALRTSQILSTGEFINLPGPTVHAIPFELKSDALKIQQLFAALYRSLKTLLTEEQEPTLIDPLLFAVVAQPFLGGLPTGELLTSLLTVLVESAILKNKPWRYGNRWLMGLSWAPVREQRPKLSQTKAYQRLFNT